MLASVCSCCFFVKFLAVIFVLLVLLKIYIKLTTGWCRSQTCLKGKTAIVTGANTGIGYETAIDLAKRGARVIIACRDQTKAEEARDKIISETGNDDVIVQLVDFASLQSVRDFAKRINETEKRLDILVNNAGVGGLPHKLVGPENLELTILVNYYSPFLLTNLLLGLLKKTYSSRVVNVSSEMAKYVKMDINNVNGFKSAINVYGVTKLYNILFTIELAKKLKHTNVTTYSLHPGAVKTDFLRNAPGFLHMLISIPREFYFKNALEGAQTTIYCSVAKGIEKYNGEHFHDCHYVERYKTVDPSLSNKLWNKTKKLVKLDQSEIQY